MNKVGRKGIDRVGLGVLVVTRVSAEPVVCRRFAVDSRVLLRLCDGTQLPILGIRSRPLRSVVVRTCSTVYVYAVAPVRFFLLPAS